MWQAPNQRVGAIQNAKKRQQERINRPIHIKRVRVEIRLIPNQETHAQATTSDEKGEMLEARVLLNDLSSHGIGIYSAVRMNPGQSIQITLDEPKKIQINGEVIWCQEQATGAKILSAHAFNFRVGVSFKFANPEEEAALSAFCKEVQEQHLYHVR